MKQIEENVRFKEEVPYRRMMLQKQEIKNYFTYNGIILKQYENRLENAINRLENVSIRNTFNISNFNYSILCGAIGNVIYNLYSFITTTND